MSATLETILDQALALPPAERAAVVDKLLASLEPTDPGIDELWAREAEVRIAAVDAGEMDTIPAEEVFAELRRERESR